MAKILVSCAAVDGHMNPFVPIVAHLVKLGHEIVWVGGRKYLTKIESTGAKFLAMPKEFDPNGMDLYEFKPKLKKLKGIDQIKFYVKTWCYDSAAESLRMIDVIRDEFEPDIYIGDPMVYSLYFKAELLSKPSINLHVIPLPLSSRDHGPFGTGIPPTSSIWGKLRIRLMNFVVDKIVFRDLKKHSDKIRKSFGLKPYDHLFNGVLKRASKVLTVTVPSFDYKRSDMPKNIEYIGPILPKVSKSFVEPEWWSELKDDRPVILVNQGTIANDISELILPAIMALGGQEYLVIAVPVNEEIKDLPNNVKVASFIPFGNLLPHVDVMVTNGGFGATHMALAHGIPIVASGGSEDKMEVSARVDYSGCGVNLKKLTPSSRKIKQAVEEVMSDPKYKKVAKNLQKEITSYSPLELIERAVNDLIK